MTGTPLPWADACEAAPSALEFREQLGRRIEKSTDFRILFFVRLAPFGWPVFGWFAPLLVPLPLSMCQHEACENPDRQTSDQADDSDDLRARPHLTPPLQDGRLLVRGGSGKRRRFAGACRFRRP
jgi:hypothetical protein